MSSAETNKENVSEINPQNSDTAGQESMEVTTLPSAANDDSISSSSSTSNEEPPLGTDADFENLTAKLNQIKQRPYDYGAHIAVINLLRKLGHFDELVQALETLKVHLPVRPNDFLKWVEDEMRAQSPPERIMKLFEDFLLDFPGSGIWLDYIHWACSELHPAEVRELFERAIIGFGQNMLSGGVLWACYRDFEALCAAGKDGNSSAESTDAVKAIYQRQLSIPLIGMEETHKEFTEAYGTAASDPNLQSAYESALKEKSALQAQENLLLNAAKKEKAEAYLKYIDAEVKTKNPNRTICLFERAIADCPNNREIWHRYLSWADRVIKTPEFRVRLHERSIRFHPNDGEIWQEYLFTIESTNCTWDQVMSAASLIMETKTFSNSEAIELRLNLAYQCRRMNSNDPQITARVFEDGAAWLKEKFGVHLWDMDGWYRKCWARFLATTADGMDAARSLWDSIMADGHGTDASLWVDYIWLERQFGDKKHVARLFPMAMNSISTFQEAVFTEWLQFVREEGTLAELMSVTAKLKAFREKQKAAKAKAGKSSKATAKKSRKTTVPADKQTKNAERTRGKKRSLNADEPAAEPPAEKVARSVKTVMDANARLPKEQSADAELQDGGNTVFVSNLDFKLPKERLEEVFSEAGEVKEVRLVMMRPGRNKGYAYVEFKDAKPVADALAMDRRLIDGRPMYVSEFRPKTTAGEPAPQPSGLKFSSGLEKNKLFVRNIGLNVKQQDLEEYFKPFGELRSVRLVLHKSGQSKGLAYVEYADDYSAALALEKTDNANFMGKPISVQISNPPPRRPRLQTSSQQPALGQAPATVGGPQERPKRLTLLPRAVRAQNGAKIA